MGYIREFGERVEEKHATFAKELAGSEDDPTTCVTHVDEATADATQAHQDNALWGFVNDPSWDHHAEIDTLHEWTRSSVVEIQHSDGCQSEASPGSLVEV